jgi:choice-of-anchor B domain-containing protein
MEVYGDHVYIGSEQGGHGLIVFDLRQLRDVVTPPVEFTETFRFAGVGQSHTITVNPQAGIVFINGSRSASACAPGPQNTGGPVMLSAQANPSAPVFVGCNLVDGYTHDSQCVTYNGPSAAFAGREICFNSNEDTLTIVDVTDKQAPSMVSRTSYPGVGYTHQGWLTSDSRYFLLDDELDEGNFQHPTKTYIFDLLNLAAPVLVGTHFGTTAAIDHNQYIVGRYSYQSNYRAGLRILHTGRAGLGRLREVAYFDIYPANNDRGFQGSWANYPFFPSGNVVVNTIESNAGIFVVRPRRTNLKLEVAPLMPGSFRFTLRNEGPSDVESAEISLSGGSIWSLMPSQGSCARRPAACDVGALASGASATVDVVMAPFSLGVPLHASVEGTGALDEIAEDDAVDVAPALGWR